MKILLLIFFIAIICNWIVEAKSKFFVIRNPKSGLVLEQTGDFDVRPEVFTGFQTQLWKLKRAPNGKILIISMNNNKVLDILEHTSKVIVSKRKGKRGSPTQQWYVNSDDSIINGVGDKFALDISEYDSEKDIAGAPLLTKLKRAGDPYQKFVFQYL